MDIKELLQRAFNAGMTYDADMEVSNPRAADFNKWYKREVENLNLHIVIKSVCEHDFEEIMYGSTKTMLVCKRCRKRI
jgi:hypothetical protein